MNIFRDFARDLFGLTYADVPETIPLRVLGLVPPMPSRETIVSAFRRRVLEVHPDLQLAYDNPVLQAEADVLSTRPEIRELVWARDVLVEMVPDPDPGRFGGVTPTVRVCRKCHRELEKREYVPGTGRREGWCWRCRHGDEAERARARRRRRRADRRCARCALPFTPSRSDGQYCSPRCRQAAFRSRRDGCASSLTRDDRNRHASYEGKMNATNMDGRDG